MNYPVKAVYNPDTKTIEYQPVKSIKGDAIKQLDIHRVGGYMNVYTDNTDKDLHQEYFNKRTDFMDEMGWSMVGKPILINHALDGAFKGMNVGVFDFETEDDIGRYVEGHLYEAKDYEEVLRRMRENGKHNLTDEQIRQKALLAYRTVQAYFATGKAHWSSGALPQLVEVDPTDGHIKTWARIEGSATYTPAEPDGTEVTIKGVIPNVDYTIKRAFQELGELIYQVTDSPTVSKDATEHKATGGASADNEAAQPNVQTIDNPLDLNNKGYKQMSLEEMLALLRQLEEAMTAFGQSAGASEEDATMMAEEVTEEMRAMEDEEELKGLTAEAVAEKAYALLQAKVEKHQNAAKVAKNAFQNKASDFLKRQPATNPLPAYTGGGNGHNGNGNPRITVGESQKYAHMSAEEMALAFKVLESAYHPTQRKRLTLGQMVEDGYVSPEFVKTWQHKAARTVDAFKFRDDALGRQSESTLKSIRFLKADELNSSDITGQGSELPGVFYDNTMWERARERTELFNMLVQRGLVTKDIPQGAETVEFKIDTSSPTVFTRHQARSLDATGRSEVTARITPLGTDNLQATPAEHVLATSTTDILTEDSVINLVNYLNQDIQRTLAESLEDALINGDSETAANTNINLIDDTPETGLSRPLYIAWDGFRKHALVTHSGQANNEGAALSIDTYFDTVAEFDDNAIESRTNELVFIVDKDTHRASRKLPELLTPGVAMQGATIYVGELPDIDGVAIYRSGFLSKSNTSGKISVTPGNNTKGQVVCVYPYYWGYGRKRAIQIENDRDIMAGVTVFVASVRHVLVARSAKAATISYNITV